MIFYRTKEFEMANLNSDFLVKVYLYRICYKIQNFIQFSCIFSSGKKLFYAFILIIFVTVQFFVWYHDSLHDVMVLNIPSETQTYSFIIDLANFAYILAFLRNFLHNTKKRIIHRSNLLFRILWIIEKNKKWVKMCYS